MGRRKIKIKRIENNHRTVTYRKRSNGLIKMAKEITALCDANVSLIIFSSSGKIKKYCSPSTTLVDILEEHHENSGLRLWDPKHEDLYNEVERVKRDNADSQIEHRHLKGEDINSLSCRELIALENALQNGLDNIHQKQEEYINNLVKNEELMEAEIKFLKEQVSVRENELNFQMVSLAFEVQSTQPKK